MRVSEMLSAVEAARMTRRPELLTPFISEEMEKGADVLLNPWELVRLLRDIHDLLERESKLCGLAAEARTLQDAVEQAVGQLDSLEAKVNTFVGRVFDR